MAKGVDTYDVVQVRAALDAATAYRTANGGDILLPAAAADEVEAPPKAKSVTKIEKKAADKSKPSKPEVSEKAKATTEKEQAPAPVAKSEMKEVVEKKSAEPTIPTVLLSYGSAKEVVDLRGETSDKAPVKMQLTGVEVALSWAPENDGTLKLQAVVKPAEGSPLGDLEGDNASVIVAVGEKELSLKASGYSLEVTKAAKKKSGDLKLGIAVKPAKASKK